MWKKLYKGCGVLPVENVARQATTERLFFLYYQYQ